MKEIQSGVARQAGQQLTHPGRFRTRFPGAWPQKEACIHRERPRLYSPSGRQSHWTVPSQDRSVCQALMPTFSLLNCDTLEVSRPRWQPAWQPVNCSVCMCGLGGRDRTWAPGTALPKQWGGGGAPGLQLCFPSTF